MQESMGSAELASTSAAFIAIIKFPLHQERIKSRVRVERVCLCVRVRACLHACATTCAKDFGIIQLNGCQRFDSLLGAYAPVELGSRNC